MKKNVVLSVLLCLSLISCVHAYEFSVDPSSVDWEFCAGSPADFVIFHFNNDGDGVAEADFTDCGSFEYCEGPGIELWPWESLEGYAYTAENMEVGVYNKPIKISWSACEFFDPEGFEDCDGGIITIPVNLNVIDCSTPPPPPRPIPEFPSPILPITLIIGVLGTILFIQRTREN